MRIVLTVLGLCLVGIAGHFEGSILIHDGALIVTVFVFGFLIGIPTAIIIISSHRQPQTAIATHNYYLHTHIRQPPAQQMPIPKLPHWYEQYTKREPIKPMAI